jgi:hypothetical protein
VPAIPTLPWSTHEAVRAGLPLVPGVQATVRERVDVADLVHTVVME